MKDGWGKESGVTQRAECCCEIVNNNTSPHAHKENLWPLTRRGGGEAVTASGKTRTLGPEHSTESQRNIGSQETMQLCAALREPHKEQAAAAGPAPSLGCSGSSPLLPATTGLPPHLPCSPACPQLHPSVPAQALLLSQAPLMLPKLIRTTEAAASSPLLAFRVTQLPYSHLLPTAGSPAPGKYDSSWGFNPFQNQHAILSHHKANDHFGGRN